MNFLFAVISFLWGRVQVPTWAAARYQWLGWQRSSQSAASNGWVKVNATQGFIVGRW